MAIVVAMVLKVVWILISIAKDKLGRKATHGGIVVDEKCCNFV